MELGGVIIEVKGEEAFLHHGGFEFAGKIEYDPIPVSWSINGLMTTFDLRDWTCRIMQVIWPDRRMDILAYPISVANGCFHIDWSTTKELAYTTTRILRAEDAW
jgi:hypothetical protein